MDESQLSKDGESITVAMSTQRSGDRLDRYSTLNKLIRITATCVCFVRICRKEAERAKRYGPLSIDELEHAKKCLIKKEQRAAFAAE